MTLDEALWHLAKVHTIDDEQVGFCVQMGAMPAPWEKEAYVAAWKVVREHSHLRTEPGQYPAPPHPGQGSNETKP